MATRFLCVVCLALLAATGWAQLRQEINLGGEWQFVKVRDLATGPPADGWQPMQVPGVLSGYDYERAWFRRSFTVPEGMRGQRRSPSGEPARCWGKPARRSVGHVKCPMMRPR